MKKEIKKSLVKTFLIICSILTFQFAVRLNAICDFDGIELPKIQESFVKNPPKEGVLFGNSSFSCEEIAEGDYNAVWIRDTSAWLENYFPGALLYDFRFRKAGESDWIDLEEHPDNSRKVAALVPSTEYEYQTRVWCDTDFSEWSDSKFFTTKGFTFYCDPPGTDMLSAEDSTGLIKYLVCSLTRIRLYQFRYRCERDTSWVTLKPDPAGRQPTYGLGSDKGYTYQCRIMCIEGELSNWSDSASFETSMTTAFREFRSLNWQVYPNPASDYLEINMGDPELPYNIQIIDQNGKTTNELIIQETNQRIALQLNPGFYVLRCRQGDRMGIEKLVIF